MIKIITIFLSVFILTVISGKGQNVVINEIMASNQKTIYDEDGDTPDWIELFNMGSEQIDLSGFSLSDDSLEIQKWQFNGTVINPGEHLLIFASEKDRNMILSHWETIITEADNWKYKIGDASIPSNWINPSYNDTGWDEGASGFGYEDGDDNTDLQALSPITSIFIRKNFTIENLNTIVRCVLHVDYDDGFVAYINGVEVARSGIGTPGTQPAWDEFATGHEAVLYTGGTPEKFDIDWAKDLFIEGENTIAIQVHNTSSTSSDMSLIPFLSLGMTEEPNGATGSPAILGLELDDSNLHTNFKVNASGESIILSDTSGAIIDLVDIPASASDISYGRICDGVLPWIFQLASPGSDNTGQEFQGYADSVSASLPAGFYSSAISVELLAGDSRIFYTLDGSDPDTNSTEYTAALSITETEVLKARSYQDNYLPSPIIVKSYFLNESTDLPVISLVSDPDGLFDYENGIYADGPGYNTPPEDPHYGANFWKDWEREASIEFFEDDKQLGFSENAIIAIFGAWSRMHPQKSFSVKFKSDRGKREIHYPLFPGLDVTTFKSFLLRNSGNDFWNTHVRDAMMQALIKDLDIDYQEYRPAVTFINGEYWGIYNIREKLSEHYIANRHNVDPDNIDMLENNASVIHGDAVHYNTFINYIDNNDMTTDISYEFVNEMIDLNNCLLYYAYEMYINNRDWPGNNLKYWRERTENGKWRWLVFDTDFGFNLYGSQEHNEDPFPFALSDNPEQGWPNPNWSTLIMRRLLENPVIQNKFINLFADLLNTNLQTNRVVSIINDHVNHVANDIDRHRSRFGVGGEGTERMIEFAEKRPGNMRNFIRNYFGSGSNGNLTINSSDGGKVILNSLSFSSTELPWTGTYFQNNAVQLTAVPEPGYKFDGWTGSSTSTNEKIAFNVTSSSSLTANFSIDTRITGDVVINEINYHSADSFYTDDWVEIYNQSDKIIDVSDWILTDGENEYNFPINTILDPGAYLVIVENDSAFSSRFPEVTNYLSNLSFGLSNGGEYLALMAAENYIIDSLTYDDQTPWPMDADGSGATLELLDPALDNSVAENWRASYGHGTPGAVNSVYTSTEIDELITIPNKFTLSQNYPNPFNPITIIRYSLAGTCHLDLSIYNILGQKIVTLVSKKQEAGHYKMEWDAHGFSSGIYFYKLVINSDKERIIKTKKMILLQ